MDINNINIDLKGQAIYPLLLIALERKSLFFIAFGHGVINL